MVANDSTPVAVLVARSTVAAVPRSVKLRVSVPALADHPGRAAGDPELVVPAPAVGRPRLDSRADHRQAVNHYAIGPQDEQVGRRRPVDRDRVRPPAAGQADGAGNGECPQGGAVEGHRVRPGRARGCHHERVVPARPADGQVGALHLKRHHGDGRRHCGAGGPVLVAGDHLYGVGPGRRVSVCDGRSAWASDGLIERPVAVPVDPEREAGRLIDGPLVGRPEGERDRVLHDRRRRTGDARDRGHIPHDVFVGRGGVHASVLVLHGHAERIRSVAGGVLREQPAGSKGELSQTQIEGVDLTVAPNDSNRMRIQRSRIMEGAADSDGVTLVHDLEWQEHRVEPRGHVPHRQRNGSRARVAVLVGDDRRDGVGLVARPVVQVPVLGREGALERVEVDGRHLAVAPGDQDPVRVEGARVEERPVDPDGTSSSMADQFGVSEKRSGATLPTARLIWPPPISPSLSVTVTAIVNG